MALCSEGGRLGVCDLGALKSLLGLECVWLLVGYLRRVLAGQLGD